MSIGPCLSSARTMAVLFAAFVCVLSCIRSPGAQARDLAVMNADEIKVLQQRLTDAGCYKGALDGKKIALLETAKKSCPDQEPILRIETGMHVARIDQIGMDAQCTIAATASED